MMELGTFLSLVLATFVFAISPGPCTLSVLAASTRSGPGAGLAQALGAVCGDALYLLIALFSLSALASVLSPVMVYVKWIGAGYLIYLGYRQFTQPALALSGTRSERSTLQQILVGFLISGTNPKVVVFYLSFLPLFVDLEGLSVLVASEVMVTVVTTVFSALAIVCFLGAQLRRVLDRPVIAKRLNQVSGTVMMGVGVAVARS